MELSSSCMACMVKREEKKIAMTGDEHSRAEYMRKVLKHIASSDSTANSPCLVSEIDKIYAEHFGVKYSRQPEKNKYNKLMLGLMDKYRDKILAADDPVLSALRYARAGNYIDFGAVGNVSEKVLMELLDAAESEELEKIEYEAFLSDLDNSDSLVYITDNCGEVVLDMLLIEQLKRRRPKLTITALVRGEDALNDVTPEDAEAVGLPKLVPVVGNGTSIGGTELERISDEARELLLSADMILAKGQGNFETMYGRGLPVYYAFLCKCQLFTRLFSLPVNTGVFKRESSIRI